MSDLDAQPDPEQERPAGADAGRHDEAGPAGTDDGTPAQPGPAAGAGAGGDATAPAQPGPAAESDASDPGPAAAAQAQGSPQPPGRPNLTRLVTALLLVLLGFSFTIQVRSVANDPTVAALGQEDLVRILANLDAHEERLRRDIGELEEIHRRLTSAGQSQQEALAEAARRADELGVLAGTLPVEGPGVVVTLRGGAETVTAARILDAVQELRSAGAEAMQISGSEGPPVRIVASTYFVDEEGGVLVDRQLLRAPYTLTVIGDPDTLAPALRIPGGVVESVQRDGGTVTVQEEPGRVEVSAVRERSPLRHARPDS